MSQLIPPVGGLILLDHVSKLISPLPPLGRSNSFWSCLTWSHHSHHWEDSFFLIISQLIPPLPPLGRIHSAFHVSNRSHHCHQTHQCHREGLILLVHVSIDDYPTIGTIILFDHVSIDPTIATIGQNSFPPQCLNWSWALPPLGRTHSAWLCLNSRQLTWEICLYYYYGIAPFSAVHRHWHSPIDFSINWQNYI